MMKDPTQTYPCPRCDGSGTVHNRCPYEHIQEYTCEECNICAPFDCPTCFGRGEIDPSVKRQRQES